ncbi:MAG: Peptidyl-dipeptidase Dcp [Actinomycetota bacterium]
MTNPLLNKSALEYELPDFARLSDDHYLPAFEFGCSEQLREVDGIVAQTEVTFDNTLVALERSGQILNSMLMVFYNKTSADTSEKLQAIEAEIAPRLAAHNDAIRLNPALYQRLTKLEAEEKQGRLELNQESSWLLRRYLLDFRFAGAALDAGARNRVAQINERASSLEAEFDKRVLADTNDLAVFVSDVGLLKGLSEVEIQAAKAAAEERGQTGFALPLLNYSGHPLLAKLENRELRRELMQRTLSRSSRGNVNDTSELVRELLDLRREKALLFGYRSFAEYVTAQQTAGSPERVHEVLKKIAPAAIRNARAEAEALQHQMQLEYPDEQLMSWDWDRYTERERSQKYSIDTCELKPFFELNKVLVDGVFYAAEKLYGLTFKVRKDLVGYHPDVQVYEVFRDSEPWGLYLFDPYARPSKAGGAWMNNLVDQSHLLGKRPVVVNNMNIPKPAGNDPCLMTFDEVNTLFHEFGHTLHGLLSDVYYPRFSGTNVERDFVEFPSQVNEMWMLWPEVLRNYAVHHETGEPLDLSWIDKLNAASSFNEGFETTHYLQAAILDLALHEANKTPEDLVQFERDAIAEYGLWFEPVPTRYRTNYFAHIFMGGYSAGYYGYIWSEVLDADTVNWFKENGGFTRENGQRFSDMLLSKGGSEDSLELYRKFRGRDADIRPLLERRGLL